MPRKSAASLSVVRIESRTKLRPPAGLAEPARSIFIDLVATNKPDHFKPSDMPLLTAYCEAAALNDQASAHLRDEGAVIAGRVSAWVTVGEKSIRALVALSMRLRLSPQSRAPNNSGSRPSLPTSHYEKMAIDEQE
jgi:phage terminase small subunit